MELYREYKKYTPEQREILSYLLTDEGKQYVKKIDKEGYVEEIPKPLKKFYPYKLMTQTMRELPSAYKMASIVSQSAPPEQAAEWAKNMMRQYPDHGVFRDVYMNALDMMDDTPESAIPFINQWKRERDAKRFLLRPREQFGYIMRKDLEKRGDSDFKDQLNSLKSNMNIDSLKASPRG